MPNDELKDCMHCIEDTGKSLLAMAEDVLEGASKDIASSGSITKRALEDTLSLNLLKKKLGSLYKLQATAKSIDFEMRVFPENAEIEFNKNHVLQILGNLISNAIKFTPPEGQVIVSLDLESTDGSFHLLADIQDTGPGMGEKKEKHYETEECVSGTGSAGESGFGFGLVIVKRLVDQMKGEWTIDSAPGEGTTISLRLPV